jgi:hypothetical protein
MQQNARNAFLALIVAQAVHSIEEYAFGLWRLLVPQGPAIGALGDARAAGFAVANVLVVAFGVWCYICRVRADRASATRWMWLWVLVEFSNGVVHTLLGIIRGSYFPGLATAPVLLVLAVFLAVQLFRAGRVRLAQQPD